MPRQTDQPSSDRPGDAPGDAPRQPASGHSGRGDIVAGPVLAGTHVGRGAAAPTDIPLRGWKAVALRVLREISSDQISLTAAGCAFYATLALFPAISTLVSIYGLAFDPKSVEPQLNVLSSLLPPAAFQLIHDRVQTLVSQPAQKLGAGLLISAGIALWSAASGTKAMLWALNVAYEEREKRGFLRFQVTALTITLVAILGTVIGLALLLGLPAALSFVGLPDSAKGLIRALSFIVLVGFVLLGLSMLYRYGPSRRPARGQWVTPGSVVATVLWLLASVLFSVYVARFASYDATYGPIGAAVAVMMWFFVSAYVVLLGAELNAELELQTAIDSTDGASRQMGERGAYVADHVAH